MTSRRPWPAACLLVLALLVSGCATARDAGLAATMPTVTKDLSAVRVTGEAGAKPIIQLPTPFSVARTQSRIITAGSGPAVKLGQRVTVQYVGLNGTDGKQFDTSWGGTPATFVLSVKRYLPGLVSALSGVTVGSRVLVAVPPKDGYGVHGVPAAGIGPTDTLVMVVDVESARDVLTQATGTAMPAKKGLPTVRVAPDGRPTVTIPKGTPPTSLVVQQLIQGKGVKVEKSQQVTVTYSGVIWSTRKVFDSSWSKGEPAVFTVGVGRLLTGWDIGLVGQPVGSRLLLVIPPDDGYGAEGNDQFGISGTDTLVFVVDILDTA